MKAFPSSQQLIGKNLGQLFTQEIHIENLPPLQQQHRNISSSRFNIRDVNTTEDIGISQLFTTRS